jgi:cellobiose phosphorylase
VGISQAVLGIRPTLDGLQIDPCIPADVKGYTVIRRYRGATYEITVENPDGAQHGVRALYADGKPLSGTVLPVAPEGSTVKVCAVMG